jgi:hypothetical protein
MVCAWQAALPGLSSALSDDIVLDVMAARSNRVVLLTSRHLGYIVARRHSQAEGLGGGPSATIMTYKVCVWEWGW